MCDEIDPTTGRPCTMPGRHIEHGWQDQTTGAWTTWIVEGPPAVSTRRPPTSRELMDAVHGLQAHARNTDPVTSHAAARHVLPRGQATRLLIEYGAVDDLTDEEAAERCGFLHTSRSWWQRCAQLRVELEFIEPTGEERISGTTGEKRMVCRITDAGRAALASRG